LNAPASGAFFFALHGVFHQPTFNAALQSPAALIGQSLTPLRGWYDKCRSYDVPVIVFTNKRMELHA
jgi:hypothetical protein